MYYRTLSRGVFSSLLVSAWGAEYSTPGFCTNLYQTGSNSFAVFNTCWLQGEIGPYNLLNKGNEIVPSNNITEKSDAPTHPWTQHPICTDTQPIFCVYTSSNFFSGRGISIIGTPESVELISRNRVFYQPPSPNQSQNDNLKYELRELPGRGVGLLAKTVLSVGDEVMAPPPVIAVQAMASQNLAEKELWELFRMGIKQLPTKTRNMYLNLQGNTGGDEVYDRFKTNAFGIFDYDAVFPEAARMNHDCRPNARYYFDKKTFTHRVHATRSILPGEEITITYLNHYLTSKERHQKIHTRWNFTCGCKLCSASKSDILASDTRLNRISDLEFEIEQGRGSLRRAEELVALYEAEELEAPASKAYEIAAIEYAKVGDLQQARSFIKRAVEMGRLRLGPGSNDVKRMVRFEERLEMERRDELA